MSLKVEVAEIMNKPGTMFEVAEKVENPIEIVIPDDNIPLVTTTESKTEEQRTNRHAPCGGQERQSFCGAWERSLLHHLS